MKRLPYHGAGILAWWKDAHGKTEVLLGLRKYNPQANMWSIPGGEWDERKDGFEEGTTPDYRATAIRETWEEIRLSIDDGDDLALLWRTHIPFYHFRVFAYPMPEKRNLVCHEEFSRLRWFPVDDLPNNTVSLVRLQVSALRKDSGGGA
ncbi:MAG TPA: NUDIX hydrolase [Sphaerochaeta sp.]|nr:NUDIX hydrolase [Sphaerochaeta sp.]HPB41942.1 NUDIX hydrolase [Sphaerochaeta sp.]HPY45812.1 NUDIX hydrolase [Sphaerochaeta sp.]HQB05931.1 NUDIX hydrolase [Sphaerochaeta sp.]